MMATTVSADPTDSSVFGAASPDWKISAAPNCRIVLRDVSSDGSPALALDYTLTADAGCVDIQTPAPAAYTPARPIVFRLKNPSSVSELEIKFIAANGSVFGRK